MFNKQCFSNQRHFSITAIKIKLYAPVVYFAYAINLSVIDLTNLPISTVPECIAENVDIFASKTD